MIDRFSCSFNGIDKVFRQGVVLEVEISLFWGDKLVFSRTIADRRRITGPFLAIMRPRGFEPLKWL